MAGGTTQVAGRAASSGDAEEHAPLAGDWSLWRDLAVRSAGFPAAGLDALGPGDEPSRLREVARDPAFQEAVTWQNPAALEHAVLRVAAGRPDVTRASDRRRRESVVASYWQRYCAKNDTIGFFGPLAWGRVADEGPRLAVRPGPLERARSVHLEAWGVQALAETLDPGLRVPTGPRAEHDLRAALAHHADAGVRGRGLAALDRLEAARDAVAAAPRDGLREALRRLDTTFVALTGREPVRNHGRAYGARTLAYVDCLRDVEVTVGPELVAELAPALQVVFEASRWYCGQVHAIGRQVLERALPAGGRGPLMPVLIEVLQSLMRLPPELGDEVEELQRRLAALLADTDPATIGARAEAAFADHGPAWPYAVFHSVDVQLAARDAAAVAAGDYLAVVGDVHPGDNPLGQGLFADRHPDPPAMARLLRDAVGAGVAHLLPPLAPGFVADARGTAPTDADGVYVAALPETRARDGRHTWLAHELLVDGDDVVHPAGGLRVPLLDVLGLPIFIAAVRTFELLPDAPHADRVSIGRTVLRREGWSVPAASVPARAEEVASFARALGMPRLVFTSSPLERKPMYLDVESPALCRILCRQARQAAAAAPDARLRVTEMLPGPEACWLEDEHGSRFVSELRLVAVDERRRADRC